MFLAEDRIFEIHSFHYPSVSNRACVLHSLSSICGKRRTRPPNSITRYLVFKTSSTSIAHLHFPFRAASSQMLYSVAISEFPVSLWITPYAHRERFELSEITKNLNGFGDHRIKPLCHLCI